MSGPNPTRHDLKKGDQIYITRVAYPKHEQLIKHCKLLTVEHCTDKALLVTCGESQQWFPLAALTPSSNTQGVYLAARWLKLSKTWQARTGTPVQALRSK